MRGTLTYISSLLLNATFVRTVPATPRAGTDSGISLIQVTNPTPGFPDTVSSLLSTSCSIKGTNSNHPLSAGDFEIYQFAVPDTTTILTVHFCPSIPLTPDLISETINAAHDHMAFEQRIYGEGPLKPADDPYMTPVIEGKNCHMEIKSQRTPGTGRIIYPMTYQVALNALKGLYMFLYEQRHFGSAVTEVADPGITGDFERIGLVGISPKT